MALYYNASDVYVHAARVDTFPNSVLEAMACGVPVVASVVGGIPEQVISLSGFGWPGGVSGDEATGVLVPFGQPGPLTAAVMTLFAGEVLRNSLSRNARTVACKQFDVARQTDQYMELYCRVLKHSNPTIDSAAVPLFN